MSRHLVCVNFNIYWLHSQHPPIIIHAVQISSTNLGQSRVANVELCQLSGYRSMGSRPDQVIIKGQLFLSVVEPRNKRKMLRRNPSQLQPPEGASRPGNHGQLCQCATSSERVMGRQLHLTIPAKTCVFITSFV